MSITAPVFDKSDPRLEKLSPFHLPLSPDWDPVKDWFSQTAMVSAGAGMFLKNPLVVWVAAVSAVISLVNHQPLRAPKDATSPLLMVGMGLIGVIALNTPKIIIPPGSPSAPSS